MECKFCKKELTQTPGKKKKEFCGETCRSNYWYGLNKKGRSASKTVVQDLNKQSEGAIRNLPKNNPKTNYTINTEKPKNLDELKLMCPKELTGFDRSAWISENRQKYAI